jgi:hypothetical protein
MESNREESIKCLRIAENSWRSGDKEKAERFAHKAMKLYPSNEAKGEFFRSNFQLFAVLLEFQF